MKKKWMPLLLLPTALIATAAASDQIVTQPFWVCADDQGHVTYARAFHPGDPTDLEARTAAALGHKTMHVTTKKGLAVPFCWEEIVHIRNDDPAPPPQDHP